jgi:hypothetical protein
MDRLSFLAGRLGPGFERRVFSVLPGCSRTYDQADWADWQDALVVVELGEIEPARGEHRNEK